MDLLPFEFARKYSLLTDGEGDMLYLTRAAPLAAVMEVQRVHGVVVQTQWLDENEFEAKLQSFYAGRKDSSALVMADIQDDVDLQSLAGSLAEEGDLLARDDDAPIIRLLNAILAEALYGKAQTVCWGHIGMDGMQK